MQRLVAAGGGGAMEVLDKGQKGEVQLVSLNLAAACICVCPSRVLRIKKPWVGPKNIDEKEASISYFFINEGGSQKYG